MRTHFLVTLVVTAGYIIMATLLSWAFGIDLLYFLIGVTLLHVVENNVILTIGKK